jgi:predicted nucleotidyltransferase
VQGFLTLGAMSLIENLFDFVINFDYNCSQRRLHVGMADLILLRSKTRKKLLSFFLSNEQKKYYLRELERLTGISVGNIRRELEPLKADNFFVTERLGNLLFYKLNMQHPLYKEVKKILMTEIGIEADIKNALAKVTGVDLAFIYGSYASKKARSDSDVDLLVIGSPNKEMVSDAISKLEKKYQREINYQIYSKKSYKEKSGSNNSFLSELNSKPKIFLIGDSGDI